MLPADLVKRKAEAEIEKARLDAEKLKREIEAVLPADIVKGKAEAEIEKARLDAEKLERETEAVLPADIVKGKAEAEIKKAKLDAEKLEREARHFWMEPVKVITGVSSILLALVAVGGLWVSFQTSLQTTQKAERDAQRLEREVVSSLVKDLGAEQRGLRATSALRLGYYATDGIRGRRGRQPHYHLGRGRRARVQEAILQALGRAGRLFAHRCRMRGGSSMARSCSYFRTSKRQPAFHVRLSR